MTEKEKHIARDLHSFEIIMQVKTPSEDTRYNYLSNVRKYLNEIDFNAKKATSNQIIEYISKRKSRSSMAQCRSALKVLYELVYKQKDKVGFIPYPKQEERLKDVPTHDQMIKIIDSVENTKHKLIMMVLYGTGCRLNELLGLQWKDIRRETGKNPLSIKVHGKGAKDRLLPLSENIRQQLVEYCKQYKLKCDTNKSHYIFGDNYGRPYSAKSVANVVERAGGNIGIKLTPHLIRHACMTSLSINGLPLLEIQDLCGHSSAKTTRIYAKNNNVNREMPI